MQGNDVSSSSVAPLLEVNDLSAGYRDLVAIRDISLSVHPGKVTVLLGRNGAGKSTTLLTIAGLAKRTAGQILLDGVDITDRPPHVRTALGIALVPENKRIFRRRTVEENLAIGGYILRRGERRAAVRNAYDRFPMLHAKRHEPAGGLSGGQQQMLSIAQALMPGPRVLMLDEPTAGLAPVIVKDVLEILGSIKAEDVGVLLVEQLVDQAMTVADRVVLLDHGRVQSSAEADGLHNFEELRNVYLGGRPDDQP
ncbi:ABC transporter ATP-binding protein [Kribbella aluminosa]